MTPNDADGARPVNAPHSAMNAPSSARLATLACLAVLGMVLGRPAFADDGVVVVPYGGVTDAPIFDLDTSAEPVRVRDRGRRRLVTDQLGPVAIRDLKILPDNSNLLADLSGYGFAVTDPDGQLAYALAPGQDRPRVTSASVTAYAAPGEPARVLITDSNQSLAAVVDPTRDETLWQFNFALPAARADFAQAIALPDNRAAIGMQWPSLGLSAIDVYKTRFGQPTDRVARLASATHSGSPLETVVVDQLAGLRDLMGLPNGHLLVTTRFRLAELTTDGRMIWQVDIGQSDQMHGELASARMTDSGRIAVATFEPGVWTAPDTNHRVYWLSTAQLETSTIDVVAATDALAFAPARLEVAGGHGGSGTFGYRPGLDTPQSGPLEALTVAIDLSLTDDAYQIGQRISGAARIRNGGDRPVSIGRASIDLRPGACGGSSQAARALADITAVQLAPDQEVGLQGDRKIETNFPTGRWCAQLFVQSPSGAASTLGTPVAFDISATSTDPGSTITVTELDHTAADGADAGRPAANTADGAHSGCGCRSSGSGPPLAWLAVGLVGLGGLLWRRL